MEPTQGPERNNIVSLPKLPDSTGPEAPGPESSQQQQHRPPEPVANIERALGNERILNNALSECLEYLRTASTFLHQSSAKGTGVDTTLMMNARVPLIISLNKVENLITLLGGVNLPPSTGVPQDLQSLKGSIKESLSIFSEPAKGRLKAASDSPESKSRVGEVCASLLKTIAEVELLVGRQKIDIERITQELGLTQRPPGLPPHENFPRESA